MAVGGRSNSRIAPVARRKLRSRDGISTLEFAVVAPLMLVAITGLYDATNAYLAWLRVNQAAQAIAEIATSLAAGSVITNTLNLSQATQAASAIFPYLPSTLSSSTPPFSATISSIAMVPTVADCTSSCTYTAHVAWSGIYESSPGAGTRRPCDAQLGQSAIAQVSDAANPSPTTLPVDAYSVAPLLVADVTYTFKPMFYTFVTGNVQMMRSAYFPARAGITNAWIQYVYVAPDSTVLCTGYPAATS